MPDKPGQLGNVSSLIGQHKLNISNLEMAGKNPNYINFKFQLIIRDLKILLILLQSSNKKV